MVDWDALVIGPLTGPIFGEPFTFIPASGDQPFAVGGVFMEAYQGIALAGGQDVNTVAPMLGVQLSAFQSPLLGPKQDDKVTRQKTGVTYVIRDVQPDGVGAAKLLLNEA